MEDWESFPLFAPDGAEIPRVPDDSSAEDVSPALGALSHLLYDEETTEEISEHQRDLGNRFFRQGTRYYKLAIAKYSEAIAANCDIPEVTAAAYSNRAAAELKLKNYGRCLADSESCLKLQPDNTKARYRAALSASAIMRFDDAIAHCNEALLTLQKAPNAEANQKLLFEKTKKAAEGAKKREEQRLESATRKQNAELKVDVERREALAKRGITMGLPLFSQQRSYTIKGPIISGDAIQWPVLLLYPEEALGVTGTGDQSDYLEEVAESASMADILATVFPPGSSSPTWDRRGVYKDCSQLEVLFREEWTISEEEADSDDERSFVGSLRGPDEVGSWRTISLSNSLRQAISTRGYIVPQFPVFYIVPKGTYLT